MYVYWRKSHSSSVLIRQFSAANEPISGKTAAAISISDGITHRREPLSPAMRDLDAVDDTSGVFRGGGNDTDKFNTNTVNTAFSSSMTAIQVQHKQQKKMCVKMANYTRLNN